MSRWSAINLWSLKTLCKLDFRIEGRENIPTGPAIIMCKHQSAWETLALQLVFPPQIWIVKRELLWIPIYGWALATMHPISIDRSAGMHAIMLVAREGQKRLNAGLWVVVYPEGTRTAPGEKRKYQPGGGLLAEKSGYPVIPVAHNSGYFWPRNSLDKKPGTITMVIGPAIHPQGKSAAEITRDVEDWIETTVAKLPSPYK